MGIQRNIYTSIEEHLSKKEFTLLTGARQTGKTTLLRQLDNNIKKNDRPTLFLNLENKTILEELDRHPLNLLNLLPATDQRVVVLIDEIQYLKNATNFLKLLYDEYAERIKIVATGSSAFYIDENFTDSLAGRKKLFNLPTCSFDEYLRLSGNENLLEEIFRLQNNKQAKSTAIELLQNEWYNYMIYGGYPAVVTEVNKRDKIEQLKELRDAFIKRDILESGIQNETAFYNLFRILAEQIGGMVNTSELSNTLRIKDKTVAHYLLVLQKCFHIALIKPFHQNLRKELIKMPKSYFMDTGMRNCLLHNFQPVSMRTDKGQLWENACFRLLVDKYVPEEIHFWRTADNNEVDFVLTDISEAFAVEAKFSESMIKPGKYKKFTETYPKFPLRFVCVEPFDENFFRSVLFSCCFTGYADFL